MTIVFFNYLFINGMHLLQQNKYYMHC